MAVITTFVHLYEGYSVCSVVGSQLRMLLRNGYDTTFVACDGFRPEGIYCEPLLSHWRMPEYLVGSDSDVLESLNDYYAEVEKIVASLRPLMPRIDVALTHDIAYLRNYLAYNQACRQLAREFPHVTWLHFIHSAPWPNRSLPDKDPRSVRFKPFPNSYLVYPNSQDIKRLAAQYGVAKESVKVVPHAIDWENAFDFHPLTRALIQRYELFKPDVFAIYPIRMDRGKQPEKLVRLFAALKACGASVRLIIIAAHSAGQKYVGYRDEILSEMATLGLTDDEVVFTNHIRSLPGISPRVLREYQVEVPHRVILDLFRLTNIYFHPSSSESYSLVCQEAAACGNLLVLNEDFPAMRALYGPDAHYVTFSSLGEAFRLDFGMPHDYVDLAEKVIGFLGNESTIRQRTRLRQTRNMQTVFRDWLEPLLFLSPR